MELGVLPLIRPATRPLQLLSCAVVLVACQRAADTNAASPSQTTNAGTAALQPSQQALQAASATEQDPSTSTAEPAAPTPQANTTPTALPKGTTVLHVGDSFAGALGLDLNRQLDAVGIKGVLKYQTSSYIVTWAWGKELGQHLANYHPDLVLVTLGANELEIPDPHQRVKAIRRIVDTIGQRPCVWIGPPLWQGARPDLLEVVREEVRPCLYLDSTAQLPDLQRARDGIHPSSSARLRWAKQVMKWLAARRDPNGPLPWSLTPSAASLDSNKH